MAEKELLMSNSENIKINTGRDSRGRFTTGNTFGGRPKGVANKETVKISEFIIKGLRGDYGPIDENIYHNTNFLNDYALLEPKLRIKIFLKLQFFLLSKNSKNKIQRLLALSEMISQPT